MSEFAGLYEFVYGGKAAKATKSKRARKPRVRTKAKKARVIKPRKIRVRKVRVRTRKPRVIKPKKVRMRKPRQPKSRGRRSKKAIAAQTGYRMSPGYVFVV